MTSEERAWAKDLFLSHSQLMFRVAAYRLRDEERAKDLVQEVFLLLMVRAEQVRAYENPPGWLFETLRRSILAEAGLRTRRRGCELPLDERILPVSAPLDEAPLPLADCLPRDLREKDREILLLYFEEGLTHKEIAQRLNIAEGTCYTRLCRAKDRCRALMKREREDQKKKFENV